MKIISFGEILWDVYPDKRFLGGAPLNFAAHLAKHGEDVYMLSSVGNDELGHKAVEQIRNWGIKDKYISVSNEKSTGVCSVSFNNDRTPQYTLLPDRAYDYIITENITETFDVLYFGTMALRNDYSYNSLKSLVAKNKFNDIFVDINIRPPFYTLEKIEFALKNATILKISLEELPVVAEVLKLKENSNYKVFVKELFEKYNNLKLVLCTLGSKGAYAAERNNPLEFLCGVTKDKPVSFVGAGDSFSAAFLHKYYFNSDIQGALEYASKVAGFVVSQYSAVPEYNIEDFTS